MIDYRKAKALMNDPTFTEVVDQLKQQQVNTFINSPKCSTIERENAYDVIKALEAIENALKSAINNEKFNQ